MFTCLFCESGNLVEGSPLPIYFNEKKFTWHRCKNCGLLFLLPPLDKSDTDKMYSPAYHKKYYFNYTENYATQLKVIAPYHKKTVLDFGCGDAGLLFFLHQNNYAATGVEYDLQLVQQLARTFKAIRFIQQDAFWNDTEKYDIIHLGDVLEHVSDPISLMRRLQNKLAEDGLFFIEGPLEQNPNLAYYFRKCTYQLKKMVSKESVRVKEPYHITFSNAANQQLFFDKLKLQQLHFSITEAGWPYVDTLASVKSPWLLLQYVIARISILFSLLVPGWGNRFLYIGKQPLFPDQAAGSKAGHPQNK